MIYELSPARFMRAAPLFENVLIDKAAIWAVLEGIRGGKVYVDDPDTPTAAMLVTSIDEVFVVGDTESTALREFIKSTPAEIPVFRHPMFAFFTPDPVWADVLNADSGDIMTFRVSRSFEYTQSSIAPLDHWRRPENPPTTVIKIDDTVSERLAFGELKAEHRIANECQPVVENNRLGFCTLVGNEIVSVVRAIGLSSRYASVSIETAEAHRRKGYATLTCVAFIHYCLENGMTPLWNCLAKNIASAKTAQKLGFVEGANQKESAWKPYGEDFQPIAGKWQSEAYADYTIWREV